LNVRDLFKRSLEFNPGAWGKRRYTSPITQRHFVQSLTFGCLARANPKTPDSKELIRNPGIQERNQRNS